MKRIMILAACAVLMSLDVSAQKPGTQSSGNNLNNMDMSRQPGTLRTQEQREQQQNMDSRERERQSHSPASIDAQRRRDERGIGQDTSRIPRRDTVRTPVPTPPVPPPVPTPSDTPGRR